MKRANQPLKNLDGELARRHDRQQRDERQQRPVPAVRVGVGEGAGNERGVPTAIVPRYPAVAWRKDARRRRCRESGLQPIALFELTAAFADQVVADVRFARLRGPFRDLPGAFDALQGDA